MSPLGIGSRLGNAPLHRHGEELRMPTREDRPLRGEEHVPLGSEAADQVVAGVPGQPGRLAAVDGNRVNVEVAVVRRGERDRLAVGRESRPALHARVRGQPARSRAVGLGRPDVVGVDERDLAHGDRRRGQQPRVARIDGPSRGRRRRNSDRACDYGPRKHPERSAPRHHPSPRFDRSRPVLKTARTNAKTRGA